MSSVTATTAEPPREPPTSTPSQIGAKRFLAARLEAVRASQLVSLGVEDFETIAQEVSSLGQRVSDLEARLEHVEKVNTGLEEAALTTARALQDISTHWDKVYEAIRRKEPPAE
jgi:predicted  nucleic acid-binding Zn-ribbon protein